MAIDTCIYCGGGRHLGICREQLKSMNQPKKEDWEKEYRLGFAKILGREGKFAMNSYVELVKKQIESAKAQRTEEIKEMLEEMKIELSEIEELNGLIHHETLGYNHALDEAIKKL